MVRCIHCTSTDVSKHKDKGFKYKCNSCKRGFNIKIGFWGWTWRIILLLIIISVIAQAVQDQTKGIGDSNSATSPQQNNDPYAGLLHDDKLVVLNVNSTKGEFGNLEIIGTAQNIAGYNLDYAEIDVKFYDKDGAVLSTSLANINNLGPGEKWKFSAMYLGIDSYRVGNYTVSIGSSW